MYFLIITIRCCVSFILFRHSQKAALRCAMSTVSYTWVDGSFRRISVTRCLCTSCTHFWMLAVHSSLNWLPLRVMQKSSGVICRQASISSCATSSTWFKQMLICLNWGLTSRNQLVTSAPFSSLVILLSSASNNGTISSGFLLALSFLFFSRMASRSFNLSW